MPDAPPDPASEPAVVARGLTLRGPWGPVYGPVDLDIPASGVTVLICPAGSGRTALAMTLAGRMRPDSGSLSVFGRTRARDIFALAALAGIDEPDTVAESVTVGDLITEQLRWDAPWHKLIRRADEDGLRRVCGQVFGELPLPSRSEFVAELTELDGLLLRIALANTRRPELLVVGDLEQVTSDRDRGVLVDRLVDLGRTQTVLTSSVNGVAARPGLREIPVANISRAELAGHQKGGA
ncbi:hypothetical protein FK535_14700 [Mycolicibacterium sp. 018/SC-01/001]|uniref:hypothetical protein n=1 Tax=Mycolicibacterium sp. 018/SC-01/001 TaxID=2592069 RepID=UPI00117ECA10|nr:hypothetical protein [Mycolicibacterium sp. 018/SC-01/001]TRW82122.1 hypothetical protein FK535_14700 [Mycolicibacterium sp. 018/SC-01/001]